MRISLALVVEDSGHVGRAGQMDRIARSLSRGVIGRGGLVLPGDLEEGSHRESLRVCGCLWENMAGALGVREGELCYCRTWEGVLMLVAE